MRRSESRQNKLSRERDEQVALRAHSVSASMRSHEHVVEGLSFRGEKSLVSRYASSIRLSSCYALPPIAVRRNSAQRSGCHKQSISSPRAGLPFPCHLVASIYDFPTGAGQG